MKLNVQKKMAARMKGISPKRVKLDEVRSEEIKEAITKQDLKSLIGEGLIKILPTRGTSRVRANKIKVQKSKGRRKGVGSQKGTKNARHGRKETWMAKVRTQRKFIKELKEKDLLKENVYRNLYLKVKSGYFRTKRHIKLFINENELTRKKNE